MVTIECNCGGLNKRVSESLIEAAATAHLKEHKDSRHVVGVKDEGILMYALSFNPDRWKVDGLHKFLDIDLAVNSFNA